MSNNSSFITGRLLPGLLIAAIAIALGIWAAQGVLQQEQAARQQFDGALRFPEARELAPFSLADHEGNAFDNRSLLGHWSFIFFGYTHCPDVCPSTLSVLNSVAQRLAAHDEPTRFVMVSVDPGRDTPARLGEFVRYFNGEFIGVTGSETALAALTGQMGIMHRQVEGTTEAGGYLVDHTASVFLVDPDGRYHALFSPPLEAARIAATFRQLQQAHR